MLYVHIVSYSALLSYFLIMLANLSTLFKHILITSKLMCLQHPKLIFCKCTKLLYIYIKWIGLNFIILHYSTLLYYG